MIRHRYRRIVLFWARHLSSFFFLDLILPRVGLGRWSRQTRTERMRRSAAAFRTLAVQLGGVLIKVGQFLSSRVDVLPPEITNELAGLQDEVPPENFADIRKVAEGEFGQPLEEKYAWFDPTPLAAASLGQVHRARIRNQVIERTGDQVNKPPDNGEEIITVVVKIQRPNIENIIATDLAALRTVGGWLRRYKPISRRADVPALLNEFTTILYEEIDYLAEGRNAETFAANFADQPEVRVPGVIWTHTTKRVLTLEDVWAIKITDYAAIEAAGIDRKEVATRLLDTYFRQIFEDGFFHADPHPGNLFVQPNPPVPLFRNAIDAETLPSLSVQEREEANERGPSWQLTFIDFGMVGRVLPNTKAGLREMLIAVGTQDSARMVNAYQMLGVLLPSADLALIEKAEAKAFERFWGKSMNELREVSLQEVRQFADEFRELIYSMPFQVPQNLIFLARAVGILSGMCTGLDPELNLWDHLAPFTQKLVSEEARTAVRASLLDEIGKFLRTMLSVPRDIDEIIRKMDRGEIAVRAPEVSQGVKALEGAIKQTAAAIVFTGLLLGGILLYLGGQTVFGEILLGGAGISLVWALLVGRKQKNS